MTRSGSGTIDVSTDAGRRAADRLERELIAWMTTVAPDGTPQTSPIWFLWDGESFLVYSRESARIRNIGTHPRVSLNLDGNGHGGDIVVVEGLAEIDRNRPSVADNLDYLEKYGARMERNGWSPEWFAERYSVPVVVVPTKYRYW